MKNFKVKWLLLSIILSVASIHTAWADDLSSLYDPYFYYYNSDDWDKCMVLYGRVYDSQWDGYTPGHYTKALNMSAVSGTKLYYVHINDNWNKSYNDIAVLNAEKTGSSWGDSREKIDSRWSGSTHTNNHILNYRLDYHRTYLWDGKGASTITCVNDQNVENGYTSLNHSQTVNKYTYTYDLNEETQSYKNASVNSGTVTISAYKMTAHGTASNENNSATIDEASETEVSVDAAYTGEVTLTATPEEGFYFVGWYSSGGTELGTNTSYTYNAPNSTYEVHARFAPCLQKTLYLKSSWSSGNWVSASALLFAKYMNDSDDPRYVKFNMSNLGGDYYAVTTPAGNWTKVQMLRVNPDKEGDPAKGIWNSSSEMTADGIKNCVTLSDWDNSGSLSLYAPIPCIIGSMNNNCPSAAIMHDGSVDIRLEAHKTYEFKVIDGSSVRGLGNNVWTSSVSNFPTADDGYQIRLCTAGEGDYTFAYNGSDQLSVTYPDVTHPSADYCYLIDYTGGEGSAGSDWSGENTNIHFEHNASNGIAKTTWSGTSIPSGNKARIGSYNYFYYSPGEYPDFNLSKNGSNTHQTGDQSANWGQYLSYSSGWGWRPFSFTITLTNHVTTTSAPSNPSVEFNGTAPSNISAPTCEFYTFGGYYSAIGGGGEPIINNSGYWQASKTGYTDGSTRWIHEGGTATLYAKWTQTISLDLNGGSSAYASISATYNATLSTTGFAAPTKDGYAFEGYWTSETDNNGDGKMVISKTGVVQTNVTDWTDASGKWIHNAASTLHAKWRHTGVYTFHYGDNVTPSADQYMGKDAGGWSGEVLAFPSTPTRTAGSEGTYTEEYDVDFTVPDPTAYPKFFVCYEELFKSNLNTLGRDAASTVRAWSDNFESSGQTHGRIKVLPGYSPLSGGVGKTAEGATGKLTIRHSASAGGENLNIGFTPSGYGLTIVDNTSATTKYAFHCSTGNDKLWETDVFVSGLSDAQVAGTFKVGLATATANTYVDCYQSAAEAASALNGRKVTGTADIAAGKAGRFQILIDKNGTNFSLRYVPLENKAKGGTWSYPSSWTLGRQPTIDEDVIIDNGYIMNVDIPNAQAKSVKIDRSVNSITRLIITPTGGLLVKSGITAKHEGEDSFGATNHWDVYIRTDYSGNGGLICGDRSTNTSIMYEFYTKSYKYKTWYINQYIGIPFESLYAYQYYGFNIFEYSADDDDWRTPGSSTMAPWTAYNLIRQYTSADWAYFDLDGVLNLPGTNDDKDDKNVEYRKKVLTCGWRTSDSGGTIDEEKSYQDFMFANSWAAPISVKDLDEDDYVNLQPTIYIFNAGYVDPAGDKVLGATSGTWSAFPFDASSYMDNAVIPATQAFLVTAKSSGAKLTLDYKKHVYDPARDASQINTFPTRAPKRIAAGGAPNRLKMVVRADSVDADILYLFEREDFTYSFEDGWDGYKILGDNYAPQLYALSDDTKLAVNAVPEFGNTEVGFKAGTQSSTYTFYFDYEEQEEPLYLYDKVTQEFTLINNDATYSFTTSDTGEHARFVITRSNAPQIATSYEELEAGDVMHAEKFLENDMLFIRHGGHIYNAEGILVK